MAAASEESRAAAATGPVIFVRDLGVEALIGAYAHERAAPRVLLMDIEIELWHALPSYTDRLHDTVDYGAVIAAVRSHASANVCHLLERLVENVAQLLLRQFGARRVRISAAKVGMFTAVGAVGVSIERFGSEPDTSKRPQRTRLAPVKQKPGGVERRKRPGKRSPSSESPS